jgi:hypothetical protein
MTSLLEQKIPMGLSLGLDLALAGFGCCTNAGQDARLLVENKSTSASRVRCR